MGVMNVVNRSGDTQYAWDVADTKSVETAAEQFERMISEGGMAAFVVDEEGVGGGRIHAFDKEAYRIVFVPQLMGG